MPGRFLNNACTSVPHQNQWHFAVETQLKIQVNLARVINKTSLAKLILTAFIPESERSHVGSYQNN